MSNTRISDLMRAVPAGEAPRVTPLPMPMAAAAPVEPDAYRRSSGEVVAIADMHPDHRRAAARKARAAGDHALADQLEPGEPQEQG